MGVSPSERDSLREQAFAMSLRKVSQRQIAEELGINKETVNRYIRQERQRRTRDRDAESAIRDGVSVLRSSLQDQYDHLLRTHATGPMGTLAKAKLAESIRRTVRDLVLVYGISLPPVDGEAIAIERLMDQVQREVDAEPVGFPDVTEETKLMEHLGSPNDIHREYEEWREGQEREGERRAEERERLREAERRMEEEAERLGFTSWEEVLNSPEYDDGL